MLAPSRRGRTVAVLGSGMDVIYPSEHKQLAEKIAAQGAVDFRISRWALPRIAKISRSEIASSAASSAGVDVVEASLKSGSLITARMAMEQGREVLAVPGSIFNESSQGCHALIRDGATLDSKLERCGGESSCRNCGKNCSRR